MKVLIANANIPILKEMMPSLKFEASTENTSTFIITRFRFKTLEQTVKAKGYNPYALMSW